MAQQWYVTVEGEQKGPISGAELKQLVREGRVTPDTPVSTSEDGETVPASRVKGLFDTESPSPEKNSNLQPCPDCERSVSRSALTCPGCGCPLEAPQEENKYPALVAIAELNKFFAIVVPILCLIGLILVLNADVPGKEAAAISIVVYMVLAPLFMWGSAELILLLIDVERNTRKPSRARHVPESTPSKEERVEIDPMSNTPPRNLRREGEEKFSPDLLPLIGSGAGGPTFIRVSCEAIPWKRGVLLALKELGFVEQDTRPLLVRLFSEELRGCLACLYGIGL